MCCCVEPSVVEAVYNVDLESVENLKEEKNGEVVRVNRKCV